jgi:hypothetical protein
MAQAEQLYTPSVGNFVVELYLAIKYEGKKIEDLIIHAANFGHSVRWEHKEIPSALALLSELTDLPERLLLQISGSDVDRVKTAFSVQAPFAYKDVVNGNRPWGTPAPTEVQSKPSISKSHPPPEPPTDEPQTKQDRLHLVLIELNQARKLEAGMEPEAISFLASPLYYKQWPRVENDPKSEYPERTTVRRVFKKFVAENTILNK